MTVKHLKGVARRLIWTSLSPMRFVLWGHRKVSAPRRILLLNAAHLGDVVVSTGILPVLRSAFPNAEIGYVAGSWAMPVLKDHPLIQHIHCIDSPSQNRSRASKKEKRMRYRAQRTQVMREIKKLDYDWAIALNRWTPYFLDLAFQCRIPVRAAFRRHLLSLLATHVAPSCDEKSFYTEGACQEALLRALEVDETALCKRHSMLPPSKVKARQEIEKLLEERQNGSSEFYLFHIGSSGRAKEMPVAFWRAVAGQLAGSATLVFTGRGEREKQMIDETIGAMPRAINAADRLSWDGLVAAVRGASAVFSVDTVTCHVAAAVDTPLIAIYAGIGGVGRWRPESARACIWTNHVDCSPCGRVDGCAEMNCMKRIRPEDLVMSLSWVQKLPANNVQAKRVQ